MAEGGLPVTLTASVLSGRGREHGTRGPVSEDPSGVTPGAGRKVLVPSPCDVETELSRLPY